MPNGYGAKAACRFRSTRPTPPWRAARCPNPAKGLGPFKLAPLLGFLWFSLRHSAVRTPRLTEVATFGDGATLDVPGSPRVILVPGHTPGNAVLHVSTLDALFVGDAFCTYAVTTGRHGPQVAPFTADAEQAVASLSRIEDLSSTCVLPGHGDTWPGGVEEAVRLVRSAG